MHQSNSKLNLVGNSGKLVCKLVLYTCTCIFNCVQKKLGWITFRKKISIKINTYRVLNGLLFLRCNNFAVIRATLDNFVYHFYHTRHRPDTNRIYEKWIRSCLFTYLNICTMYYIIHFPLAQYISTIKTMSLVIRCTTYFYEVIRSLSVYTDRNMFGRFLLVSKIFPGFPALEVQICYFRYKAFT